MSAHRPHFARPVTRVSGENIDVIFAIIYYFSVATHDLRTQVKRVSRGILYGILLIRVKYEYNHVLLISNPTIYPWICPPFELNKQLFTLENIWSIILLMSWGVTI